MPRDFRPELDLALLRLRNLLASIYNTGTARFRYIPPIIDRDSPEAWIQNDILGYVKTVQLIEKQLAGLEAVRISLSLFLHYLFLCRNGEAGKAGAVQIAKSQLGKRATEIKEDPLPIALSLETFWKSCLVARAPVTGMKLMMKGKGKEEAFVDVIARGGAEWIKLWTKKDKQLISEFKEQDSYVNSDWDDSDSEVEGESSTRGESSKPTNGHTNGHKLTNSLIEIAESLLSVASSIERPPGVAPPRITMRLSRMEEFPFGGHEDERISATFGYLRSRGVNLEFGDLENLDLHTLSLAPPPPPALLPSLKINLDPTALVGLCSDIIHHPLPLSPSDARARFFRPSSTPTHLDAHVNGETPAADAEDVEQSKNSRELYKEVLEEMSCASIEAIRDTCALALHRAQARGEQVEGVEFWVTEEALRHLREAMCSKEVIGEGMEQRRMRRLIGLEQGDFWEGSRYERKAGILSEIRLHVFPPTPFPTPMCGRGMTTLHHGLAAIADQFLEEYFVATRRSPDTSPEKAAAAEAALPSFLRPDRLPVPKIVTLSLPFPIVSLQSFAKGAKEGMTTLTMGNVLFREVFGCPRWKLRGWVQGNYELPLHASGGEESEEGEEGNAAVWMLPYRSFAEGKRVRFAAGDYSVPQMGDMI